jgi:hypothetical protein
LPYVGFFFDDAIKFVPDGDAVVIRHVFFLMQSRNFRFSGLGVVLLPFGFAIVVFMRFTLILLQLAVSSFLLLLISGWSVFAIALVWLLLLAVPVFLVESLLTLCAGAVFFSSAR